MSSMPWILWTTRISGGAQVRHWQRQPAALPVQHEMSPHGNQEGRQHRLACLGLWMLTLYLLVITLIKGAETSRPPA